MKNKDLEFKKIIITNPPVIEYSIFKKTEREKEELKEVQKNWNKQMKTKYPLFEKRKWNQMHTIWTQ